MAQFTMRLICGRFTDEAAGIAHGRASRSGAEPVGRGRAKLAEALSKVAGKRVGPIGAQRSLEVRIASGWHSDECEGAITQLGVSPCNCRNGKISHQHARDSFGAMG